MCLDAEGTFQCSVVIKTTVNATFQNYSVATQISGLFFEQTRIAILFETLRLYYGCMAQVKLLQQP